MSATAATAKVRFEAFADALERHERFCTTCREFTRKSTGPDACGEECPACGQRTVYGAEEVLMAGFIEVVP
jgi:hypothetical protein